MSLWTRIQRRQTQTHQAHDVRAAYEKGRRDERASRKRHPILMTGLVVLAAAGASLITLAAVKGSFGEAGAVADHNISVAAESAAPVIQNTVAGAADAARDAGSEIKDKSHELVNRDKS